MSYPNFYRPYVSDSESDSDTESTTSSVSRSTSGSFSNDVPNFAVFAQELLKPTSIDTSIGGPEVIDPQEQINLLKRRIYSSYNTIIDDIDSGLSTSTLYVPDISSNLLKSGKQQVTSIINLDSTDRDKQVFPQPTNLQLRLPRVYRNIVNFQIVQIKLLSAFYYFRKSKNNLTISINEQNRYLDANGNVVVGSNITDPNFYKTLNIITNKIREGSYDLLSLINELTIQLNTTPIFYDFVGGFNDFVPLFASTGDLSVGFNLPGDYYYDSVINDYIANPTIDQIVSKYFKSRYAGQTSYTIDNIKIAYYYPVLKEILLDNNYFGNPIDFSSTNQSLLLPGETPYTRCVYFFQGLNDQYILSVIQANVLSLDSYRVNHTFRYTLINKYEVSYDSYNNHITILTPSLNTSLVNLINTRQTLYYNQQFSKYGITSNDYTNLFTQNTLLLAVLTDMYNYLQSNFALQFAVPYNSYTLDYYGNMSNYIYLRNGLNANVSCNYDTNVIIKNIPPISNNITTYYQTPPFYEWPRLASNASSNFSNNTNISYYDGNPYNLQSDVPETYHKLINSNTFYTSRLLNHVDSVVNIDPASYVVFKFRSAYRQTLQVETLPRPTKYRYPEYNAIAYDVSHVALFDNSYNFIYNSSNSYLVDPSINVTSIPGFSNINDSNFGISFSNSFALWSNTYASVSVTLPEDYYSFVPPLPDTSNAPAYRYGMVLNISDPSGFNFANPMDLFIYKDIGAFYGDVEDFRNELPFNYISSNHIPSSTNSLDINISAYQVPTNIQTYYVIVRTADISPQVNYVLSLYFNDSNYTSLSNTLSNFDPNADPSTNFDNFLYSRSYDPNYLHLPSSSNLYEKNPLSNKLFADISYNLVPMGYDANGVSTDLTHYIGYIRNVPTSNVLPSTLIYADPITQYIFRAEGGYNQDTQTYFYSNTLNKLYTPQFTSIYNPTTPSTRQYSQVHYYATQYLPNTSNQLALESKYISQYTSPFNSNTISNTLTGYTFDLSGNLQLENGVYGLSLIPGQGTWDIQRYMFKSIFSESSWIQTNSNTYASDPNLNIKYLGIYYNSVIKNKTFNQISLRDSIATLKFSSYIVYNSSNTDYGFGSEGGTYYEFLRDSSFRTGNYSYLYGFTENSNTITNDYNNGYTILAFDANSNLVPFVGLTGSYVPYPYYSDPVASNAYIDGTTSPTGSSLIVPITKTVPDSNRGPLGEYSESQSQYQQSMPIGTTYFAYGSNTSIINSQLYAYSNLNTHIDKIIMDISGYMLTYANEVRLYSYDNSSLNRQFSLIDTFTTDFIFDNDINVSLGGIAANEFEYAFLGLSNNPAGGLTDPSNNKLIIKTMNPVNQTFITKQIITIPILFATTSVTSFTYNNYGGFTLATHDVTNNINIVWAAKESYSNISYNYFNESNILKTVGGSSNYILTSNENPTYSYFTTYQNPNDSTASFYVGIYKTGIGYNDIYYIQPSISTTYSNVTQINKNISAFCSTSNLYFNQMNATQYPKITAYQFTSQFTQLIVDRSPIQEIIYGFKSTTPTSFYQLNGLTISSPPYDYILSYLSNSYNLSTPVYEMEAGYAGALWFSDLSGSIFGNRFNTVDGISYTLNYAWQIFYPTQRVVYNRISPDVNLMPDLSGLMYPELFHTQLFYYDDIESFTKDLSQNSICSWGNESNYYISDTQFSGYYFNAYSTMIPLTNSSNDKFLVVRNYSPTEKSQVYMRFSLANRYDYGYASISDISNEVMLCINNHSNFNPNYCSNLESFNSNFIFESKVFGCNIVPGFYGITLSNVKGFGDFMNYYISYYNGYQSNIKLINDIQNSVDTNLSNFISYDLQYIIPSTAANRQRYTDPLLFSILWKSTLPSQNIELDENWGLGWNLGYPKKDTPYDVIQTATSFYKILDDYIVLRLNNEFDVNRVDTSAKEKLSATLESTGATKAYYGKLLLAPFGSYAQTMIMNPIAFNPPLGRLDKLNFTWYNNNTNLVIDNSDCEWNAVVQIVENIDIVETITNPPILNPR